MPKVTCSYCEQKVAKRYCPPLDKPICPLCCGANRLKNIACQQDCRYLDHEAYQQHIREEKEFKALVEGVPHSEHDDIFKDQTAASIAYAFESLLADCYVKGYCKLTDQKVKDTLIRVYHIKRDGKSIELDDITSLIIQTYEFLNKDEGHQEELIAKVILRIIRSIDSMTGGRFGSFGYLNFLKHNIHPDFQNKHSWIAETKDGKLETIPVRKHLYINL